MIDGAVWLLVHAPLVWSGACVLAAVAGGLTTWKLVRSARRRETARTAARFGSPLARGEDLREGVAVTLRGRLDATGTLAKRLDDGHDAAATSMSVPGATAGEIETGASARAERLTLTLGDAQVDLEGPVDVHAGVDEWRPQRKLKSLTAAVRTRVAAALGSEIEYPLPEQKVVLRAIPSGATVRASGVLTRRHAPDHEAGYRGGDAHWVLRPLEARGVSQGPAIALMAETPGRTRGPWWGRLAAGGVLGVLALGVVASFTSEVMLGSLRRRPVRYQMEADGHLVRQGYADALRWVAIASIPPLRRNRARVDAENIILRMPEGPERTGAMYRLARLTNTCVQAANLLLLDGATEREVIAMAAHYECPLPPMQPLGPDE